ncbi:AraC family transcriptional regulator [Anaerosporobacter faecicola]|uniref:AraC family transcriptional regulator n=1 Tax=Anaerosporobacter faecicola TaxID=2718714 RepID=UPI00143B6847|nr:AraC family transcriptional regulator [Anaerosporobacter faecicola]
MYTITGYYDDQRIEETVSKENFFVHCCGRYKMIHREQFETRRQWGTKTYQLLYVAEGRAQFLVNDKLVMVEKGCCVLYRPCEAQYYRYQKKDQTDVYWVHFSCEVGHPYLEKLSFDKEHIFDIGVHTGYEELFMKIIQELQMKESHYEQSATLLLMELLLLMSRNMDKKKDKPYAYNFQVEKAIRYFHSRAEEEILIKEYAKEQHLNYYRFIDSFTKYTGYSPKQYIIQIRMRRAKDLLTNENILVSEVANLVGYENPLYFSRLFKQTVGISPLAYRSQMTQENLTM